MMPFIDSHAHLADPAFADDRPQIIGRARAAGACAVICIGESLAAAETARDIAHQYPDLIAFTAGVHPHDAATFSPQRDMPALEQTLRTGAVAVGECGLDYHYDNSPRASQLEAFEAQLDLARRMRLPVVVHTRDAEDDTRALVQSAGRGGARGVLHCYTGSHGLARAAIDVGWYVSFSGIVTFKKWSDDALLRLVPDDRVLVESDSPYLAPVPHRGKRNEPAWVALTLERVAVARGTTPTQLSSHIIANAVRLFALNISDATSRIPKENVS